MRVVSIPCLSDNYAYLVIAAQGGAGDSAAIVDPSAAQPVLDAIAREGVKPVAIWLTHHHWDHVGGVEDIVAAHPGIAVIARVPFDEGSLTGTLRSDSRWPEGDWRNTYFAPAHLAATLPRVERVRQDADALGMSLPELALRFILSNPTVTTTIPGMRRLKHVETNLAVSDKPPVAPDVIGRLRAHRWDRVPDDRP